MDAHARGPVVRLLTAVLTTAVALVGLVALSAATAPVANAVTTGISGIVIADGTDTPLAGMTVVAYCNDDGDWYGCQDTVSAAGGAYAFDSLPPSAGGAYHVGAYSDDNRYATTFFGGTDEVNAADLVPPVGDVELRMAPNAAVKGRVGTGLLNAAVPDAEVCLYEQVTFDGDSWWSCAGWATTSSNGTYTAYAPPGTYRVGFSVADNHLREVYYANAATVETGTNVVLTPAGRTGINVKMVPNAKVTGKVTAETGGAAIPGAQVWAHEQVQDGGTSSWEQARSATADSAGNYELYLAPGTYRVQFDNPCNDHGECSSVFKPEFWNNKDTVETANDVTVPNSGAVSGISGALARNAKITGTVTAEDGGAPIAGAQVGAWTKVTEVFEGETYTYWEPVAWADADNAGAYTLYVPTGTYRISFDDRCEYEDCEDLYQREYWNNAATVETAADVAVTAPASYAGKNAALVRNGQITGTVTAEAGGAPLAEVQVVALDEETYEYDGETYTDWIPVGFASTDATGEYTLNAPPGTHRIGFSEDCSGADCRYLTEYYDDAATPEQGVGVTVAGPATVTPDIDAALAEGSQISGTLTDNAHAPVEDASVTVYAQDGGDWSAVAWTWSDRHGNYAALVPDGSYRVGFTSWDGSFTDEFYDDSHTLADADTVVVAGADKPHVDATLGLSLLSDTAPSIPDADPKVGETVTADPGTWSATPDAFTYRWFQAGTAEPIGTSKDLVVPAGALGKVLTVEVTATKAGYATGVATSDASAAVAQGVLASTAKPTVSGAVSVGSTVSALEGTWSATPDGYTYEWFQSGTPTAIGTGKELTIPAGALGKTLTVKVTATKAGHTSATATSDPTAAVAAGGLANTTKPVITGDPKVGGTVQASDGTWSHAPDQDGVTYRWFQEGTATAIGTSQSLVVPASALGKKLTVEVTATATGYGTSSAVSDPSAAVVFGTFTNDTKPTITGSVKVGGTVQAVEGSWTPAAGSYLYQWLQDGTPIADATAKTLVVPASALDKKLTVEVTARKIGYQNKGATSDPTATVALGDLASTGAPTITGTVQVGKQVSAGNGTWSATPDSYTYRWFQDGTATPIGTGKDLVVPAGAAGKTLTVEVTAKAAAYHDGVASSAPSGAVAPGDLVNNTAPSVSGTAQVGKTLTAHPGTWTPAPAADGFAYQWLQDGTPIPDATGKELVVPASAEGRTVTVEVTATVAGYAPSSVESIGTGAVVPPTAVTATSKPGIAGTVQVGQTLTAQDGTWSTTPDSFTYRWFQVGSKAPIGTGKTFVVPPGVVGWSLVVEVTPVKAGFAGVPALSAITAPVALGKLTVTGKPTLSGTAKVGKKLKVVLPTAVPAGATVKIQWLLGKRPIPGATKKGLKLDTKLYRGTKVRAVVVWTLPGYAPVTLKTAKVTIK
jgi:hypothetical protein